MMCDADARWFHAEHGRHAVNEEGVIMMSWAWRSNVFHPQQRGGVPASINRGIQQQR